MSVMLNMILDENLKMKGMAREIVNKVQKLRKAVGLHIDDHVEVFYKVVSGDDSQLSRVVSQNIDSISSSLRTAFLNSDSHMQKQSVKIAETEYVNPENEKEIVKLYIC